MHIHEPIQEIDAVSHEVLTCVLKNIFDMKICVADFFLVLFNNINIFS